MFLEVTLRCRLRQIIQNQPGSLNKQAEDCGIPVAEQSTTSQSNCDLPPSKKWKTARGDEEESDRYWLRKLCNNHRGALTEVWDLFKFRKDHAFRKQRSSLSMALADSDSWTSTQQDVAIDYDAAIEAATKAAKHPKRDTSVTRTMKFGCKLLNKTSGV